MPLFQGIGSVALYIKSPGTDVGSVLFETVNAKTTSLDLYAPAKGEKDATGGSVYSGETCKLVIEGADSDGSRLAQLREWFTSNQRVSAAILSADRSVYYNWLEADRLSMAKPVPILGELKGRSDFVQTALMRTSEDPDIHVQRNFVSHLDEVTTNERVDLFFPIPGVTLYFGLSSNAGGGEVRISFRDKEANIIGNRIDTSVINGRTEMSATTPDNVHIVRIQIVSTAGTLSDLSVRGDGSYEYTAH